LPTGKASESLGIGHLGVRPWILAYKGVPLGPGVLAGYAGIGFTLTTHTDFRMNLAATYDWQKIVGVLEFTDQPATAWANPCDYHAGRGLSRV